MRLNLNPANWAITNALQGQSNNTGGTFGSSFSNGYGSGRPSYGQPEASSTPQVKGATTGAYDGAMYYDTETGVGSVFGDGQWNPQQGSGTTRGGSGSAAPAYNQEDVRGLDAQKSLFERLLQSTQGTLNSGLQGLNDSTTQANNNAQSGFNRANRDFDIQREDSQNSKNQAINGVDTNARTMSDSLRRIIGMAGGSGASANLAGSNAVARQASQQRDGVMGSFGKNERNLDLAVGDTKTDFEKLLEEIKASRRTQEESLRAGVGAQEQGINQTLAEIAAERARVMGGDQLSAAQPYQDRYLGIQNQLDALPGQFRNEASRAVKATAPKLSDYLVDRQALNASKQNGGQEQYSPYKAFLDRNREEEQRI